MEKLKIKSQLVIFKIDTAYVLDDGYVRPTAYRDVLQKTVSPHQYSPW